MLCVVELTGSFYANLASTVARASRRRAAKDTIVIIIGERRRERDGDVVTLSNPYGCELLLLLLTDENHESRSPSSQDHFGRP